MCKFQRSYCRRESIGHPVRVERLLDNELSDRVPFGQLRFGRLVCMVPNRLAKINEFVNASFQKILKFKI